MADPKPVMVKVKFLKNVGPYAVGQVVELPQDQADAVCAVTKVNNGERLVEVRKAVLLSEADKLEKKIDIATATQAEMNAAGLKNVIPSPGDNHPVSPEKTQQEFDAAAKEASKDEAKHVTDAQTAVKKQAVEDNKLRDEGKPVPPKDDKKK